MIPDQFYEGHLLPIRLEIQISEVGPFVVCLDAKHRDIAIPSGSFDEMLAYVNTANATMWHPGNARFFPFQHPTLSTPRFLVEDLHPCERCPAIYQIAFECMIHRVYDHWITPEIKDQLFHYGICDANGEPRPRMIPRWADWRKEEDAALIEAGIHRAPTPVINRFRRMSRGHLTVVQ